MKNHREHLRLKVNGSRGHAEHEPEIDMNDVASSVDHDVSVVPVSSHGDPMSN